MSITETRKSNLKITKASQSLLERACAKTGAKFLGWGKHKLYSSTHEGFGVSLPGWRYPIILSEDELYSDNYNGAWGNNAELIKFRSRLTTEYYAQEMRRKGLAVTEQILSDGTIKLMAIMQD